MFWKEAEKYQVAAAGCLGGHAPDRAAAQPERRPDTCSPGPVPITGTPNGDAPSILNTSYNFKAEVEIPQGGGEGMIVTQGGRFGGYGFYVLKGKPVFIWNLVDLKRVRWEGPEHCLPASTRWSSTSSTTGSARARWPSTT